MHNTADPVDLTVVVPVYLTQRYLEQCIRSILDQPVERLEVIVVDDASPDDSHLLLSEIAAKDPRIRVLTLVENVGLGFARNAGLELAQGRYVTFLDSDDFYLPGALSRLLDKAIEDKVDLAAGLFQIYQQSADGPAYTTIPPIFRSLRTMRRGTVDESVDLVRLQASCQCLFRREFLASNQLRFRRRYFEDRDFLYACALAAEAASIFPDLVLYNYRRRQGWAGEAPSITQKPPNREGIGLRLDHFRAVHAMLTSSPRPASPEQRRAIERELVCRYLRELVKNPLPSVARELTEPERTEYYGELAALLEKSAGVVRVADSAAGGRARYNVDDKTALIFELLLERRSSAIDALLAKKVIAENTIGALLLDNPSPPIRALLLKIAAGRPPLVSRPGGGATAIVPRKVPNVLVHVGMPRTGSTYLQSALDANRDLLGKQHVVYPASGIYRQAGLRSYRTSGHQSVVHAVHTGHFAGVHAIRQEIEAAGNVEWVILSSENLFHEFAEDRLKHLRRLLGMAEPHIVVYLRRQDSWVESMYREAVTGGHARVTGTIDEYLYDVERRSWLDYRRILQAWADAFGKGNIHIRPFEESGPRGIDLLSEVLAAAGIAIVGDLVAPEARSTNRVLAGRDDVETIRLFNRLPFYNRAHYSAFVDAYHAWLAETGNEAVADRFLTSEKRQALLQRYRDGNAWIAREFLRDWNVDLFDMTADSSPIDNPPISVEKLHLAHSLYANTGEAHVKSGQRNILRGGWIGDAAPAAVKAAGGRPASASKDAGKTAAGKRVAPSTERPTGSQQKPATGTEPRTPSRPRAPASTAKAGAKQPGKAGELRNPAKHFTEPTGVYAVPTVRRFIRSLAKRAGLHPVEPDDGKA